MKIKIKEIEGVVIKCLQEIKEVFNEENINSIDAETEIFGPNGALDSMGLVSLVVDLEEIIREKFNIHVILADERAMSQKRSPFHTVSLLSRHIQNLIKQQKNNGAS